MPIRKSMRKEDAVNAEVGAEGIFRQHGQRKQRDKEGSGLACDESPALYPKLQNYRKATKDEAERSVGSHKAPAHFSAQCRYSVLPTDTDQYGNEKWDSSKDQARSFQALLDGGHGPVQELDSAKRNSVSVRGFYYESCLFLTASWRWQFLAVPGYPFAMRERCEALESER